MENAEHDHHWDVGGFGAVCVDRANTIPYMPKEDEKVQILKREYRIGGPVPTALVLLARFGRKTTFVGEWTDNQYGDLISKDLCQENIDTTNAIRTTNKETVVNDVYINEISGARTIFFKRLEQLLALRDDAKESFARCKVLHLDGTSADAGADAAKAVHENGGTVFCDIDSPNPGIETLLPHVDVAICPERTLARWDWQSPEEGGRGLLQMGVQTAIVTSGKDGSIAFTNDEKIKQPAFQIAAVDTTGAGDVFCGALIEGYLDGMSLPEYVRFATATAALKCMKMGNRDALPTKEMVMDFLSGR